MLPLQVIGKSQHPRCCEHGLGQKIAWMDAGIFHTWFHDSFVPLVRTHLTSIGQEPRAVLLIDNYPSHPNSTELVSTFHKCNFINPAYGSRSSPGIKNLAASAH